VQVFGHSGCVNTEAADARLAFVERHAAAKRNLSAAQFSVGLP
jgi:hypothetical protein